MVEIRLITPEEQRESYIPLLAYAFRPSPPAEFPEDTDDLLKYFEKTTILGVFEDDKLAAGVASAPYTQNVRGKILPMGGVWGVAAAPWARRKGYTRRALTELFARMREDAPVSMLYPFRESFYQRLGYVTFLFPKNANFSPNACVPLLRRDLGGEVEICEIKDGSDAYYAYLAARQKHIHGMAVEQGLSELTMRNKVWLAVARVDDETAGMMLYRIKRDDGRVMSVTRFFYDDVRGRYLLLEWFARHADQVDRVEVELMPTERPETWLEDLKVTFKNTWSPPMARILDVGALSGIGAGDGTFCATIADDYCPWNDGIFTFTGKGSALTVTTGGEPDCELTIQALTALVYGTHDPVDFAIRGWGAPSEEVQAVMRSLFPPALPYLQESF